MNGDVNFFGPFTALTGLVFNAAAGTGLLGVSVRMTANYVCKNTDM